MYAQETTKQEKKKNGVLFYNPFVKAATVRKRIISTIGAGVATPLAALRRHVFDETKEYPISQVMHIVSSVELHCTQFATLHSPLCLHIPPFMAV